jgi:hypothetical protein
MCVEGMIIEASYSDGFTRWERKWSYKRRFEGIFGLKVLVGTLV